MPPSRKSRPRAPHQLPPGRHKLPRSFVETNQRQRMLDAVADVTSLAGYAAMNVEQICAAAGVSRRTFYDTFDGKEDAFLTALDLAVQQLQDQVKQAYDASETFAEGVRECLAAFLRFVAEHPRYADLLVVEVPAAGPTAVSRRSEMLRMFVEMLRASAAKLANGRRPPELTAETVVGGIHEVVYSRILEGGSSELPALLPDLAYSIMQPYLGHDAAMTEAAKPTSLTPGTADEPA